VEKLLFILGEQRTLTALEWASLGISDLRTGDFVKSQASYFSPALNKSTPSFVTSHTLPIWTVYVLQASTSRTTHWTQRRSRGVIA